MKSIKPGRGPSKMSAVGSAFAAVFGIFWCCIAVSIGAGIMVPFGIFFVGLAIYQTVYHTYNATSEDRYSLMDIVDSDEEQDPLNEKYGKENSKELDKEETAPENGVGFCPYCGRAVSSDYEFCPKCGKKLPD